ncbi:MAG: UDP-N-acetylmuramoyl-L-alanine--D-glutamate ligase [Thermoleophilaceae bacterium]|nr:UDP-N-acetylmuramoyl-L-alanine--D-glutamate ligase [Thermoleophilaceae bacterium]
MSSGTTYESVPRPAVPAGAYLVVGLGSSGQSAAKLLAALGHRVIAVDSGAPAGSDTLGDFGVEVHLQADGTEFVDEIDNLVKSPGVPQEAPAVVAARAEGKNVFGELELGWRLLPNPFIAITGTNGKTTTTELIGQIYRDAGLPVAVAGNIGTPLCDLVENIQPDATVICEASSFQLEDAPEFTPECAILLNLAPDHLDRHHTFEAYREAKLGIFAGQGPGQFAVTGPAIELELPGDARGYRVPAPDLDAVGDSIAMEGSHNKENAVIATQAALLMGVDPLSIAATLATFPGLPHRMELIAVRAGVRYVNDSKATNVAATVAALASYEHSAHALIGGSPKGEDFTALKPAVESACVAVYLNGATAPELAQSLAGAAVPVHSFASLDEAFAAASMAALPGQTVLLSPAAASFDQFKNYEARGGRFRELVTALAG